LCVERDIAIRASRSCTPQASPGGLPEVLPLPMASGFLFAGQFASGLCAIYEFRGIVGAAIAGLITLPGGTASAHLDRETFRFQRGKCRVRIPMILRRCGREQVYFLSDREGR